VTGWALAAIAILKVPTKASRVTILPYGVVVYIESVVVAQ
jgi:hypothetical protein